jgi:hypothetical protein
MTDDLRGAIMSNTGASTRRNVHLVGTVPADDAGDAFRLFSEKLNGHLPTSIPDGETGDRLDWIERIIEGLRNHPDLYVAEDGDWSGYEKTPRLDVRKGHKLTNLELDYTTYFEESWPAWNEFSEQVGGDHVLQVGIPGHIDLALVAFGFKPDRGLRNLAPFRDATVREITKIHAIAGDDVVFQLEIPIPLILLSKMAAAVQPLVANRLAAELTKVIRRSPGGARFGIHLCYGDMNNEAMGDPVDSGALVRLANALIGMWPSAQTLEFVHAPFARGSEPPTLDPAFYAPLIQLELPADVRFAAGLVHEDLSIEELTGLLGRIEGLIGRPVDVGAACGLGRRDRARAESNLELSVAVAEA